MRIFTTGLIATFFLFCTSAFGSNYDLPPSPREFYEIWSITVGDRIESAKSGQISPTGQLSPMSVKTLSARLGISTNSLSDMLSGAVPPQLEVAQEIAQILEVPVEWLLAADLILNYETSSGTTSFIISSNPDFLQLTEATKYFKQNSSIEEIKRHTRQMTNTKALPSCQALVKTMISPELNLKLNPPPQ